MGDNSLFGPSLDCDDTFAIDLINRVGPDGHFLQEDHTMNHCRKVRYSKLFDRSVFDQWKEAGEKRFEDRLREITKETMDHQPAPLSSDITQELDRMQLHWK
jgi:trimethylamine--corrinoid protein Co-methyltransferase